MAIVFIRTVIVFVSIIVAMRLMGKRQLGELELSELVVAVLISDMAAHPLQDIGIPLINGLIPILTLLCCELLISAFTLKSVWFRALMWGKPSVLVEKGRIIQKELRKNRFSLDELTEALRKKNIFDISTVRYAILETNGTLNAVLYESELPVTANLLKISTTEKGMPIALISDGRVMKNNLSVINHDMEWLNIKLKERNIESVKEVYYMTLDENGGIYISLKEN